MKFFARCLLSIFKAIRSISQFSCNCIQSFRQSLVQLAGQHCVLSRFLVGSNNFAGKGNGECGARRVFRQFRMSSRKSPNDSFLLEFFEARGD